MTENKKQNAKARRTQVKDLPKNEKALGKDEMRKVKGGQSGALLWVGSAKPKE